MTVASSQLVDTNVTPWYHVISGTVRGALLLGEGGGDRKVSWGGALVVLHKSELRKGYGNLNGCRT